MAASAFLAYAYAQDEIVPSSRTQIQLSYAPVVKKITPAVVNIYTKRVVQQRVHPFMNDPFFAPFFGNGGGVMRQRIENSLGSGVIVDPSGIVITNAHVINGASEIIVGLSDGREFNAELSLSDQHTDLAVLRITDDAGTLPHAPLRPSESLEVGDLVLAIGNPFGVGQTVTSGIVSALARSALNINDYNFFIQTDAAINPGNSGGPLVSMDGGVIGINTAIYSRSGGSMGIGFAIPSEMVNSVVAAAKMGQVGENGITRPWLGATFQTITPDLIESFALDKPNGALITELHSASPLKKAGLDIGHIITAINDKNVRDPAELRFRMATIPLNEQATLTAIKDGQETRLKITAIPAPENPPRNQTILNGNHPLNGIEVSQINPALSSELELREESGVVVTNILQNRRFFGSLAIGDILLEINDIKISDIAELQKSLNNSNNPRNVWKIIFSRQGQVRQIVVR